MPVIYPKNPSSHGGYGRRGHAKKARPIAVKRPMHLTLRSSRARGAWGLLKKNEAVEKLLQKTARRFSVRVLKFANVGNHLHLLVRVKNREDFQNFLRVFTQGIVFLVAGARKGNPVGRFWDSLAFSRVVDWGRDWRGMLAYLDKNLMEACGAPRDRVDAWFLFKRELRHRLYVGS